MSAVLHIAVLRLTVVHQRATGGGAAPSREQAIKRNISRQRISQGHVLAGGPAIPGQPVAMSEDGCPSSSPETRPRCRARCEQPVETARGVSTRLSSTALERAPVIGSAIERRSSPDGPLHRGSLRHRGYPRVQWAPQLGLSGRGSGSTRRSNNQPTIGDPAAPSMPHEAPEQKKPNSLLTDTGESSEYPAHPTAPG